MSILELGALGEFVGSIGVIGTLLYLGVQIRQNMRAVRASTYQAVYQTLDHRLSDVDLEIRDKVYRGEELTPAEWSRLNRWRLLMLRTYENWWQQREYGILDEEILHAYMSHMRITLGTEDALTWWAEVQTHIRFVPGFVRFVDDFLKSNPPPDEYWWMMAGTRPGGPNRS